MSILGADIKWILKDIKNECPIIRTCAMVLCFTSLPSIEHWIWRAKENYQL